jgi:hypothetical protein
MLFKRPAPDLRVIRHNHDASSFGHLAAHDNVAACLPGSGKPVFLQYFANFAR